MTHILEALKDNLKLFELKQDSFSDVVPEIEKMYQKRASKMDTLSSEKKNEGGPRKQKINQNASKRPATVRNNTIPNVAKDNAKANEKKRINNVINANKNSVTSNEETKQENKQIVNRTR